MGLEAFERRVEGIVESMFSRAAKRGVEPVELGRRMVREAERAKKLSVNAELIPNVFGFHLSPADFLELQPIANDVLAELRKLLAETASERGYRFVGPTNVEFVEDRGQRSGAVYVESSFVAGESHELRPTLMLPEGQKIRLDEHEFTIGRLPSCSLIIDDAKVSRSHAVVTIVDGVGYLRDLSSTNGTFVNGQRVTNGLSLKPGDEIRVGSSTLTYLLE